MTRQYHSFSFVPQIASVRLLRYTTGTDLARDVALTLLN
jgi:hypothetical protein